MSSQRKGVSPEVNAGYVDKLSQMIGCKTVWTHEGTNEAEFQRFYALLDQLFPNLAAKAKKLTFGGGCFFYVIEGKNAHKNILLMSHHDVVAATEKENWDYPPFEGTIVDGKLYGRGTQDTKGSLYGELAALEKAILSDADVAADDRLAKHARWVTELKARYTFTAENTAGILKEEVGQVFAKVLEHAGVYERSEAGRAAFLRFAAYVNN